MDNQVWDTDFSYNGPLATKISCHAGDYGSRVLCNMIGDQPLFYIDESADIDLTEELIFNEETSLSARDRDFLDKMKAKIDSYDRSAKALSDYKHQLPEDKFDAMFDTIHMDASWDMNDLVAFGRQSGLFTSYYQTMMDYKITMELNDTVETSFYDRFNSRILINNHLNLAGAATAMMRAMRTAWHHKQGTLINPLSFQPDEAILINRLMKADNDVSVIAYLWDMKLAGVEDLWANAMSGADYDLCTAYAMEAMTDFRSIKSGLAMRSAFEKWFLSGRCKSYDRHIIQIMLGKHSDVEINDVDASRVIAMDLIAAIGRTPNAKNYIASMVTNIMNDTLYSEVRDRSNANFLWFINFDRRMSKMEQELQEDDANTTASESNKDNVITYPSEFTSIHNDTVDAGIASVFILDHFRHG